MRRAFPYPPLAWAPPRTLALAAALAAGCTGAIGDGETGGEPPTGGEVRPPGAGGKSGTSGTDTTGTVGSGGTDVPAAPATCNNPFPGPSPLRRLTRDEYNNTVRDLLNDTTSPANALPPEERGNGFGNDADALGVSRLLAEQYFHVAKGVAARATADAAAFAKLVGCTTADEACARTFVTGFGERAFRKPLETPEVNDLLGVYRDTRAAGADFKAGIQAVITTALQAPQFLYRVEFGTPAANGLSRPTGYEMASRLSYLLWRSMPDPTLFAAAKANKLGTKDEVLTQARRMLDDPRAREMTTDFHDLFFGLLGLDNLTRNPSAFKTYTPDLGPLFRQEISRFLDHTVWEGPGDFATFLTAPYTFMNAKLAKFYGVTGPTGDAFVKVDLDPARHAGFMTSAGIMATLTPGTQTNPVMRGVYVRNKLFCDPPPDPPATLMVKEPDPDPKATTRERFLQHQTDDACKGCHTLMDPIGFAFENYDGVGLWRTTDNGRPVDASGEIAGTDVAGKFVGAPELMKKIAGSAQAKSCFAGQWFTFAYGRAETPADKCSRQQLEAAFARSGWKVKDLILALTQTDAFLYRSTGER